MKQLRRNTWKWAVGALVAVAAIAGLSVLIVHAVKQSRSGSPAVAATHDADWGSRTSSAAAGRQLVQLPPPDSPAAVELLARNDTPAWVSDLYSYHR
jgi:hypothetical protein